MTSISSITQKYAKQQQQMKQAQKGGALFDFLKPDAPATDPATDPATAPAPKPEEQQEDKSMIDTIKGKLGFGTDADASADAPATPVEPDAAEVKEEKPGILSGLFGLGSSNKDDDSASEASEAAPEAPEVTDVPEAAEEAESSESESEASEDNVDDFDMIAQKMKSLRENYDKLKADHNELKSKMENQKAEEKKLDNSKVTTLIAAFTASQGALTAFKEALLEHLKNNNYPLDGLELDSTGNNSYNTLPAPMVEPVPPPENSESSPEPEPASAENLNTEASATPLTVESTNENSVLEDGSSESESGSESSSESEPDVNEPLEEPVSPSSLAEIPVNEVPNTNLLSPAPEPEPAPAPAPAQESINGGRSHYVHSSNKKASTHRHHKRRNRHQTLRNYKK